MIDERYYSKADRDAMPDSDFAGPHQSFPIRTQQDVYNAARLIGHADDPEAVKRRIIAIAKRKGFAIPDAWKDKVATKESAFAPSTQKIATLVTCFLEDDAISLNGRQYPREAVDRLIQSAQVRLSDSLALPLTCYLSHEDAENDSTLSLSGRITKVWREGKKAYASIDIAATSAGRDLVSLVGGQYIRSTSLRASGAEMKVDREHSFPQVGGNSLQLEGIDFTTSPGLAQTARITDLVLAESVGHNVLREVFHTAPSSLICEETMKEEYIQPQASGNSTSMDGTPHGDYPMPTPTVNNASMFDADRESHKTTHDYIADVMDACVAPMHGKSQEQARLDAGLSLKEAGRKLSIMHARKLAMAHDHAAEKAGMSCKGAYESALQNRNAQADDGMQDGDDDDLPTQEKTQMRRDEAAQVLKEAGYTVVAPKSETEILREQLAQQQATLEELKAMMNQEKPTTQRKSLAEGVGVSETKKRPYYRNGDYLRERLNELDPHTLVDPSVPLPEWLNVEWALKEYEQQLVALYDARYQMQ